MKPLKTSVFRDAINSNKSESSFTKSLDKLVDVARHNAQWRQSYMTTERLQNYARRHGFEEGIAQQKAKDEKRFAKITAQKDAEIAKLKEQLAKSQKK